MSFFCCDSVCYGFVVVVVVVVVVTAATGVVVEMFFTHASGEVGRSVQQQVTRHHLALLRCLHIAGKAMRS